MSDNKTMIRFYAFLLIIIALLVYVVDLNSQFHFVQLNSSWISNNFCFAILSGILTGLVVALATEFGQYLLHKRHTQNMIYLNAIEIYALLSVQKSCIEYYINNSKELIPENIGSEYFQQPILNRIGNLRFIDYSPFFSRNKIGRIWDHFYSELNNIEAATRELGELCIAHKQTEISFLKNNIENKMVTADCPFMRNTLNKNYNSLANTLKILDNLCYKFNEFDSKRFAWEQSKKISEDMSEKIKKNPYYKPNKK